MESLNFHNIKLEIANAQLRYRKRQRVTSFFRFMEFCIFLAIVSRFSSQLPKLSIDYIRGFGATLFSPRYIFVLGNTIVLILFLKSGHSSASVNVDSYVECKQNCTQSYGELSKKQSSDDGCCEQSKKQGKQSILVQSAYCEQSKKQGKQSIQVQDACCEQSKKQGKQSILVQNTYCEQSKKQRKQSIMVERQYKKSIHRSHSENFMSLSHDDKPQRELNRSATVGCQRGDSVKSYPEDEMSGEEFRRTVEAFIARQQRLLREEEFSAVVSYQS